MSCNSCSNVTLPGVAGPAGAVGDTGPQGSTGVFGGYSIEWQFESAITPAPTTGFLRLNDPTPASVTEIYIDETAKNSVNGANFLASIDDNGDAGNYGLIRIFKRGSSTIFWTGKVTASVDSGDYYTLTVTHISSSGTFTANDDVVVSFVANGKTGAIGTDGVAVIDIDTSPHPHVTTTPTPVKTTSIPQNTIGTVGDFIKVKGNILTDKVDGYYPTIEVKFDGNRMFWYYIGSFGGSIGDMLGLRFEIDLIVTATNTITPHVRFEAMDDSNVGNKYMYGKISQALDGVIDAYQSSITLNSGTKDITVELTSDNTNTVALTYYEVTKYLKA